MGREGTPVEVRGRNGMTVNVVIRQNDLCTGLASEQDHNCTTPVEVRGSKGMNDFKMDNLSLITQILQIHNPHESNHL